MIVPQFGDVGFDAKAIETLARTFSGQRRRLQGCWRGQSRESHWRWEQSLPYAVNPKDNTVDTHCCLVCVRVVFVEDACNRLRLLGA